MTNKVQPSVEPLGFPLARARTLRDRTTPRRGCEGIVSVVEVNIEYLSQ